MQRKRYLYAIVYCLLVQPAVQHLIAQDSLATRYFGTRTALSAGVSYSPTSQHIVVGTSENRKTTQMALDWDFTFYKSGKVALAYEGSVTPVFLESDPTAMGTSTMNISGPPTTVYFPPIRIISTTGVLGYARASNGGVLPIFPILGPRQTTYAFAALPVGVHLNGFTKSRIQPTLVLNLGALYATRNIPVDYTSSFNFLAYAGPGVEVFLDHKRSIRIEYLYEHLSNADLGYQNPGVDSGTFRIAFVHYR